MNPEVRSTPPPSLPRPAVPSLSPHEATLQVSETRSCGSQTPDQDVRWLGSSPSSRPGQHSQGLLPRSGPQFTCVEIRSGGSLVSRAVLTLMIFSAYLCSLTRLVHKHLLRAYWAPGPVLGCELFSARRPFPALGLQVSASCRKPSQTNFGGPPLSSCSLVPLPITDLSLSLSCLLPFESWPPKDRFSSYPLTHLQGFQRTVLEITLGQMNNECTNSKSHPSLSPQRSPLN